MWKSTTSLLIKTWTHRSRRGCLRFHRWRSRMATFVLVPGGWCGGWVWKKLGPLLGDAGHVVFTPTSTGLGERAHLAHADINLDTHITDITNLLDFEDL